MQMGRRRSGGRRKEEEKDQKDQENEEGGRTSTSTSISTSTSTSRRSRRSRRRRRRKGIALKSTTEKAPMSTSTPHARTHIPHTPPPSTSNFLPSLIFYSQSRLVFTKLKKKKNTSK